MARTFSLNVVALSVALSFNVLASGEEFLGGSSGGRRSKGDTDAEFRAAMTAVMGCGAGIGATDEHGSDLATVEQALAPMWRVVPKNSEGRVEWRMLRYMTHRYFMQRYNLLIRGFEPSQQGNEPGINATGVLGYQAPALVETLFQGKHNANGFSLQDATITVATLERLIFDSETTLLKLVYDKLGWPLTGTVSEELLAHAIQVYLLHWLIPDDPEGVELLINNVSLREVVIPQWDDIRTFATGMVKGMEFKRQRLPQPGHAKVAMTQLYSFDDAHEAVGSMTKSFASFWGNECRTVKAALVKLDKTDTGRVLLSDFYRANMQGEWHFGESEAYLRELGALDESSSRGKQVIIPNYVQGASNCVVGTAHYLVCCVNECEDYLNQIEDMVGASVAEPEQVLRLVRNMTNADDERANVDPTLELQLTRIAEINGGSIPLHGRLFSQWLHYVFPRECPFPHKTGSVSSLHVSEFGRDSIATPEEVRSHAATRKMGHEENVEGVKEAQWMSQWSEDEELHADYAQEMRAPWEGRVSLVSGSVAAVALFLVFTGVVSGRGKAAVVVGGGGSLGFVETKSHFV